ncbi:MAG: polysaccharide pyruvyl transferase family protein [Actinomycetales bacterium]|nr:MAG: polysaccharide pyruvyl transferase family protein [Actinomycetales bacterium]
MARILIRSGKDPFTPVSAETTLTQDVFNSNSGNLLFQHAVWKSLALDGTEIVPNSTLSERRAPAKDDARRVSEEFDHFVVPLANAFRPDFIRHLDHLSELIEGLTIPVTVVGIGAQAPHGAGVEALADIARPVRRFVSAVLDRSASIGVRGQFTRDYLRGLGFGDADVDVIGCPSLFQWGPDFRVEKKVDTIADDARLGLNLTPEVPGIGAFATAQAARHPNLVYVGQDQHDLRLLLWGTPFPHVDDPQVPVHLDHPLYQEDRMRLFLDTWPWYSYLGERDFVYGTRFHGNVAALLGGTPAMLLAHDSRTQELAEHHRMPFIEVPRFDADLRADDLHAATDLTGFNAEMPLGHARYTDFLERNALSHRWADGAVTTTFDQRLAGASWPRPVHTLTADDGSEVASRLRWLRGGMVLDITRHPDRYEPPFEHPAYTGAGSRHARIQGQVDDRARAQQAQIDRLRSRIEGLEGRTFRARVGYWLRRLRLRRD